MLKFLKIQCFYNANGPVKPLKTLTPPLLIHGFHHFSSKSNPSFDFAQRFDGKSVGIFWDLNSKPPKSHPAYDAAIRLRRAAEQFGFLKYKIVYGNSSSFSYIPPEIIPKKKVRRGVTKLENPGLFNRVVPDVCKVCGRRFYNKDRFLHHFKQIHEQEYEKRLIQIENAKGSRRVKLVGKYSMKMEKYKRAARDLMARDVGLGEELERAGYWLKTVSDKPQAADVELRKHMVDMIYHRRIDYVFFVSDDSGFVDILKEAKLRCLKTVVVGDASGLKRDANVSFSWKEIMMGKAKKQAVSVVGKWKDRNVLKTLEWKYNPEIDKQRYFSEIETMMQSRDSDVERLRSGKDDDVRTQKEDDVAWWEL